jgi:hypothetical protein
MRYKHYMIGRRGFANLYINLIKQSRSCNLYHYRNPLILVLVVRFHHWGFDLGYVGKKVVNK